jgi:Transposase DDE domain group 1
METATLPRSTQKVRRDALGGKRPDGHARLFDPRHRADPNTIHTEATDPSLTAVAGLVAFGRYLRKLGLPTLLHQHFDDLKTGFRKVYEVGDVLLHLIDAAVAGEHRVFGMEALAADPLFVRLAGGAIPCLDVFYDDLRRFDHCHLKTLASLAFEPGLAMLRKKPRRRVHVDIDTSVTPLFGRFIEGARPGPNPRYHGRPSYHPILAWVPEVDAIVGAVLRPGDTSFGEGDVSAVRAIVRRVREAVGPSCEIVVRIDSAGDCAKLLKALQREKVLFTIKAKMTPNLCAAIGAIGERQWQTTDRDADSKPTEQLVELKFAREDWAPLAGKFVVHALRSKERHGKQVELRDGSEWAVQAWVTNAVTWPSDEVSETYRGRAGIEPRIAELKNGWGLGKMPTNDFDANHALMLVKVLAYNLLRRFVESVAPSLSRWSTTWMRRALIVLPGRLIHHAHRWVLRISPDSALARALN